jgi:DNA-binding HxlR family transcriptional regulator
MRKPFADDMFDGCTDVDPPVRVGDKWTPKILRCLEDGPRRFTELRRPLRGVTAKVLTESLRAMERDGLVRRTPYDERPPRVEYRLTDLGRSLLAVQDVACAWTAAHLPELVAAREAFRGR